MRLIDPLALLRAALFSLGLLDLPRRNLDDRRLRQDSKQLIVAPGCFHSGECDEKRQTVVSPAQPYEACLL
ncbi:hypothetical protein [Brevundimonas mediterranea]